MTLLPFTLAIQLAVAIYFGYFTWKRERQIRPLPIALLTSWFLMLIEWQKQTYVEWPTSAAVALITLALAVLEFTRIASQIKAIKEALARTGTQAPNSGTSQL